MTTKKKRIPKPSITLEVDGVIHLIPFFEAKTTEDRVRRAAEFIEWHLTPSWLDVQTGGKENIKFIESVVKRNREEKFAETLAEEILKESQGQVAIIEEAHFQLSEAIRIALHQKEPNGYSFKTQEWLQEAISLSFREVHWANKSNTAFAYQFRYELRKDAQGNPLGFCHYAGLKFKNLAACDVCEAFSTWGGRSIGEYYIGLCPRCGKVFEKRREDQLYDRDTCRKEFTRKK